MTRGETTLRGVFVHGLALLGLILAASGAAGLLRVVLESLDPAVLQRETDRGVALGLSLSIVGLPVWLLAWRAAQRTAAESAAARRALPRRLHLAVGRVVSLSLTAGYGVAVLTWLLRVEPFDPAALARLVVWGAVWGYHERVAADRPLGAPGTRWIDRAETYLAAGVALYVGASGLGLVATRGLEAVYEALVGAPVLIGGAAAALGDLRVAVAVVAVAGAVWWWHWLIRGRDDAGSTLWLATLFLAGVLGGTVAAISGGAVVVHRVLAWLLRAAGEPAAVHFEAVPGALAAVLVGVAVWGHHRAHLREQAALRARGGPERTYWYLLVGAGVLTAAGGMAVLLGVGFDLLVPGRVLVGSGERVRDAVAAGLTLLAVGLPLWTAAWRHVQHAAATDATERDSLPRRILIYGAFGLAALTAIGTLGAVLFALFEGLLAGTLSTTLIEDQRWSLAALLTAGAVSIHYGLVLREDRAATAGGGDGDEHADGGEPGPPAEPLREVVVVDAADSRLVTDLRERLAVPVVHWVPRDGAGHPAAGDATELAERIGATGARRVLVLADGEPRVVALADGPGDPRG